MPADPETAASEEEQREADERKAIAAAAASAASAAAAVRAAHPEPPNELEGLSEAELWVVQLVDAEYARSKAAGRWRLLMCRVHASGPFHI